MDLKNTKGMEPLFIEGKFRKWALANGIGKVSEGSKNTSLKKLCLSEKTPENANQPGSKKPSSRWAQKGICSEQQVIKHLCSWGWEFQFQRLVTHIAEIDLIFQKENRVCLIEVKTLDNPWRSFERITDRQVQKLTMNQMYFSSICKSRFQYFSCVAWVMKEKIDYIRIS